MSREQGPRALRVDATGRECRRTPTSSVSVLFGLSEASQQ